jgi:hypothetical protein
MTALFVLMGREARTFKHLLTTTMQFLIGAIEQALTLTVFKPQEAKWM